MSLKIIHQHTEHVGKYGSERNFPDAWTGKKTINPSQKEHGAIK